MVQMREKYCLECKEEIRTVCKESLGKVCCGTIEILMYGQGIPVVFLF